MDTGNASGRGDDIVPPPHYQPRGVCLRATIQENISRTERGSATAETAIVLPVVILFVFVLAILGVGIASQLTTLEAARATTRELVRGSPQEKAIAVAHRIAGQKADIAITRDGDFVQVRVRRPLEIPLDGPIAWPEMTLTGTATGHLEPHLLPDSSNPTPEDSS